MKKLILSISVATLLFSCKQQPQEQLTKSNYQPPLIIDTVENIKIVKSTKQTNSTSTSYRYKYDFLNGKIRHQPQVSSETKYYIVYTDGTIEETTQQNGMFLEKGDTVKTYSYIYK